MGYVNSINDKIVGESKMDASQFGMGHVSDAVKRYAKHIHEMQQDLFNESGIEMTDIPHTYKNAIGDETLRRFFCEEGLADFKVVNGKPVQLSQDEIDERRNQMEVLYNNDKEVMMEAACSAAGYNPIIGLGPLVHKYMLMALLWNSGVIPKFVAKAPEFTIAMETRLLRAPSVNGQKGPAIDVWSQQNEIYKLMRAVAPFKQFVMGLPEKMQTNVLSDVFGVNEADNDLSNETRVVAVLVEGHVAQGETYYEIDSADKNKLIEKTETNPSGEDGKLIWVNIEGATFVPGYQNSTNYDRQLSVHTAVEFHDTANTIKRIEFGLYGACYQNRFNLVSDNSDIKKVLMEARVDTANAMQRTCEVEWFIRQFIVHIGTGIPINVPVSPNEIKDVQALYGINQLAKKIELINIALSNYRDGYCQEYLDNSYRNLPEAQSMLMEYDFAIPLNSQYAFDYISWRRTTFMDQLDLHVTPLLQYLNDQNLVINVIGRNDLIRRVIPEDTVYPGKEAIGEFSPDYNVNTVVYGNRTYNFFSYDKMRGNNTFIILITPKNTETFTYRLYDYQSYIGNDIRNITNPALPAIHAFERYRMASLNPLQGRVRIINPTSFREENINPEPFDSNQYNDRIANMPEATRQKFYQDYKKTHGQDYVAPMRKRNVNPDM